MEEEWRTPEPTRRQAHCLLSHSPPVCFFFPSWWAEGGAVLSQLTDVTASLGQLLFYAFSQWRGRLRNPTPWQPLWRAGEVSCCLCQNQGAGQGHFSARPEVSLQGGLTRFSLYILEETASDQSLHTHWVCKPVVVLRPAGSGVMFQLPHTLVVVGPWPGDLASLSLNSLILKVGWGLPLQSSG